MLSHTRGRLLPPLTAELLARPRAFTPPYPTDHDQLEDEDEERGLDHRPDNGRHGFGSEVERVPHRKTPPVAAFTREPVPDREGDRHEFSRRQPRARVGAKRPLEDDRPFALIVIRDTSNIARVVRRDIRTSLADELKGSGTREIEKP